MRVRNTSATALDNICTDISQYESYTITPILNGFSDHFAQLLMIFSIYLYKNLKPPGKLIST